MEHAHPTPNTAAVPTDVLTTFATLWSIASLFHIASYDHWDRGMLIVIAVVWLLLKPSSAGRLAILALAQVTVAAAFSPFISNHWFFTAFINLAILASWLSCAVRERSWQIDGSALYAMFAPPARAMLLVFYFYAVFHKLNADFFNVATSCGTDFYAHHMQRFPFLIEAGWVNWLVIVSTIAVEALVPMLLFSRKTRYWGVVLGMLFHAFIAFNPKSPFYNFSSMLFGAYALFLPADFLGRLTDAHLRRLKVAVPATVVALLLTMFDPPQFDGALYIWAFYGAAVIAVVFLALGLRLPAATLPARSILRPQRAWLAAFPLALLLNGFMPYLGLKTETSFAMYSNLRTELGQPNHFLVGSQFEIFDYQRDFVRIVASSQPTLQAMADRGLLVSWFELHRLGSEVRDFSVTYIRDGVTVRLDKVTDDPALAEPIPAWKQSLLYFRPIGEDPRQRCYH